MAIYSGPLAIAMKWWLLFFIADWCNYGYDENQAICDVIVSSPQHPPKLISWKSFLYDGRDTIAGSNDDEVMATAKILQMRLRRRWIICDDVAITPPFAISTSVHFWSNKSKKSFKFFLHNSLTLSIPMGTSVPALKFRLWKLQ